MSFHVPHVYRVRKGALASDDSVGNCGAFFIPNGAGQTPLAVIASDGDGWEHVSVSLPTRCPTWDEMCRVKHILGQGRLRRSVPPTRKQIRELPPLLPASVATSGHRAPASAFLHGRTANSERGMSAVLQESATGAQWFQWRTKQ